MEFLLSNVRILMNFFHRREKDKKEIAIHHHPNHGLFRSWTYKNERFRTCDLSEYLYKLQRVPNLLIIVVSTDYHYWSQMSSLSDSREPIYYTNTGNILLDMHFLLLYMVFRQFKFYCGTTALSEINGLFSCKRQNIMIW